MIPAPKSVLVVTPHPDDFEFGCGGIVTSWVKQGTEAVLVVATNGDKGTDDPDMTSERLAAIRREEQLKAAEVIGLQEVVFLGYPDGSLEDTVELRGKIVEQIRRHRPEAIFTTDPMRPGSFLHRDHRIIGQVTLDATFPYARDRLHYPEHAKLGLEPHKAKQIYYWGGDSPDTFVDISETIDVKIRALLCHHSQMTREGEWDVDSFEREWARTLGKDHNIPYAEAFRLINLRY